SSTPKTVRGVTGSPIRFVAIRPTLANHDRNGWGGADLVDHVREFIRAHGNKQELAELEAAEQELAGCRARKGGRPKREPNA
ncbi:hypothetical protein, partial [Streptomyces sp. NPDC059349]|uniref:hypothetical protein n=1 Tax=Streptomyces sp. NPDC059349 TaxID=3346808 RepID=UPI0036C741DD